MPDEDLPAPSDDEFLLRLGVTIKRVRRKLLGLDQAELARRVRREKNTVSRWENGRTSLSAFDLAQLWAALEVPGDWLLNPTESIIELDRRIEGLRAQRLAEAALAASALEAQGNRRPSVGAAADRPGRRSA